MERLAAQDWQRLAASVDDGLIRYDLRLVEVLLVLILRRDTFGRGQLCAPVRLAEWSRELGMRPDKLQRLYWEELQRLQILDVNAGQGTYRLRPDPRLWSALRGWRVAGAGADRVVEPELPLSADRPLSDALSDVATESALAAGPRGGAPLTSDWEGLRRSLDGPARGRRPDVNNSDGTVNNSGESGPAKLPARAADLSAGAKPVVADKSAAAQAAVAAADTGPPGKLFTVFTDPLELASSGTKKLASYRAVDKSAAVLEWVRKQDKAGALASGPVLAQWAKLCQEHPSYVLGELREALRRRCANGQLRPLGNPLGWLACRAIDDGKMNRLGVVDRGLRGLHG